MMAAASEAKSRQMQMAHTIVLLALTPSNYTHSTSLLSCGHRKTFWRRQSRGRQSWRKESICMCISSLPPPVLLSSALLSSLFSDYYWSPVPAIKHPETTGRPLATAVQTTLYSPSLHDTIIDCAEKRQRLQLISGRAVIIARQRKTVSQFNCTKMYLLVALLLLLLLMADGAQQCCSNCR